MASNGIAASFFVGFGCGILWSDGCAAMLPLARIHVILCQRIHYNSVIQGFCYLSTNVMWFYQIYIYRGLIGNSQCLVAMCEYSSERPWLVRRVWGLSECDDNAGAELKKLEQIMKKFHSPHWSAQITAFCRCAPPPLPPFTGPSCLVYPNARVMGRDRRCCWKRPAKLMRRPAPSGVFSI